MTPSAMLTSMSNTLSEFLSQALSLPAPSRAYLAERLLESLDTDPGTPLSPEWREEVLRRCREIDDGLVALRPAEEVFVRAFTALE